MSRVKPNVKLVQVVLVDDSILVRERIATLLGTLAGVQVAGQAGDVAGGMALMRELRPDVLVLDLDLAGQSGIELLEAIKQQPEPPMVIMLTNYDHPKLREKCGELGADFYFHKSTEFEKTLEVCRELSERRQEQEDLAHVGRPVEFVPAVVPFALRDRVIGALRGNEQHFNSFLEDVSDLIAVLDAQGCFHYTSPSLERMLGYTPEEIAGSNAFALIHEDDLAGVRGAFAMVLRAPGASGPLIEARYRRKDGAWRHFQVIGRSRTDEYGRVFVVVSLRDITDQKHAEAEINRINRLYDVLTQVNQTLIRARSRAELFQKVCGVAVERGGFQLAWIGWLDPASRAVLPVAVSGEPRDYVWSIRVFADERPEGRGPVGVAVQEGRACVFNDFLAAPETRPWREQAEKAGFKAGASFPIRSGGEVCGALNLYDSAKNVFQEKEIALLEEVAEDISACLDRLEQESREQRSEQALRVSEERLRLALDALKEGLWDWHVPTGRIYFSPGFYTMLGYTAGEFPSNLEGFEKTIYPSDLPAVREALNNHLANQRDDFEIEFRSRAKSGALLWILGRGKVVERDAEGRPLRMIGTHTDITEKKRWEAHFLQAQRMESIGFLAGGIAHDLNNILSPIMMVIPMLREEVRKPETHALLDMLAASARRGAEIVNQILTFSRGLKSERAPILTRPLFKEIGNIIRETFPKNISLELSAPEDLWLVEGNTTHLLQVLMNLCLNARDAMPEGGTLTLAAENVMVDKSSVRHIPNARPGPYLSWWVADTGAGIPPEILDRIFDPFFTTKEVGKGTGLGLSTVMGIVRNHDGCLQVKSQVGLGTQFRIYLPAVFAAQPAIEPRTQPPARGRGEWILVVDDEQSIREVAEQTLQRFGYRVMTARDGAEAVKLYGEHQADIRLVLTDLMMPGMDGKAVIRAVRKLNPDVPIIATSGSTAESSMVDLPALGVSRFLNKPFQINVLLDAIDAALGAKNAAAE